MKAFSRFGINYKINRLATFFNCALFPARGLPLVLVENFVTAPIPHFDCATGKAVFALIRMLLREKTNLSPCVLLYEYFDDRPYESYCDMMRRLGYSMLEVKTKRKSVLYLFGKCVPRKEIRTHAASEKTLREQYGY